MKREKQNEKRWAIPEMVIQIRETHP